MGSPLAGELGGPHRRGVITLRVGGEPPVVADGGSLAE